MVKAKDDAIRLATQFIDEANKVFFVKKAFLFGSYVTGKQHKWSDIDVAIVSPDFNYIPEDMAMKMLFRLAATISPDLEPIPLTEKEIDNPPVGTLGFSLLKNCIPLRG